MKPIIKRPILFADTLFCGVATLILTTLSILNSEVIILRIFALMFGILFAMFIQMYAAFLWKKKAMVKILVGTCGIMVIAIIYTLLRAA